MFYWNFYNYFKDKYFDELKDLPAPIREAVIFKKTVEEICLEIRDDDIIAGRYGSTVDDGYDTDTSKTFEYKNLYSEKEAQIKDELQEKFCFTLRFDPGHTCIDYGYIINNGLKAYEQKVLLEMEKEVSPEKKIMLDAMLISVEAVKIYSNRFSSLAAKKYAKTGDARFLKMKNAMSKVPYEACENFYEAITSVWTMHSLTPISDACWASISLGRMDQYLYPFYKKSLENGETTENIKAYIKNLFVLLDSYGDGACALNIGGTDEDGNDMTNEFSLLLLEVEKQVRLAAPIFTVRLGPATPEDVIDKCIDIDLFSIGQPTFYGEIPCREAMIDRGVPKCDAHKFSLNSCMGLFMSGEEIASMWGCVLNMHLPLELAINNGNSIARNLPVKLETEPQNIDSLESLLDSYKKYLNELCVLLFDFNRKNAYNCAINRPNPLLSMMTENCIATGLDRAISAKYNTETVEATAMANTTNAICAIDTLVFKQKKYTLDEYIKAAQNDFVGFENILSDIKSCEKYGTNSKYADSVARFICESLSEICKKMSHDNVYFLPSLHTLDANVHFGKDLYTTLDGRLKGEPVAKNAGPTNDVRSSDPTSLIISAASINQKLFSGGQPIDLYFDKFMLDDKEKRDKIKSLIKTYFELGGLQLQVNSIDVDLLEKAYEKPEDYPYLIVRIGGYSRHFTDLPKFVQKEFIERFKLEKGA